ncbi:RsmD family RNA methyltransferase [Fulvivirgaceae bacterium LMO-SS25]
MIDLLQKSDVKDFIKNNESENPAQLMLNASVGQDFPLKEAVAQIAARQKAKQKLPEWYSTEGIIFPPSISMEQCSSELTALFKAQLFSGKTLVDLTGGTGVDSFYFSKHFEKVQFIERQGHLCDLAKHNFQVLGADNIEVHSNDGLDFLADNQSNIDLIYLDPARRDDKKNKVFRLMDCQPDITLIQNALFKKCKQILLKAAPMLDVNAATMKLNGVKKIWVVAVENECRELLILMEKGWLEEPIIEAVNIKSPAETNYFTFTKSEEAASAIGLSMPNKYLYEPNAAILKAGGFRSIAIRYDLKKLHPNSHLYTSDSFIDGFPGRSFEVTATEHPYSRKLMELLPEGKANITARNFPETVAAIRRRTKIKDGGDIYIFATTLLDRKPVFLLCKKT